MEFRQKDGILNLVLLNLELLCNKGDYLRVPMAYHNLSSLINESTKTMNNSLTCLDVVLTNFSTIFSSVEFIQEPKFYFHRSES